MVTFVVGEDEAGSRLDLALASASGVSRAQVRRWIEAGHVRINSRAGRPAQRVRIGDRLDADPPQPIAPAALPEPIPIHVMYEDADVIVVDKPAGLVVHPAPGHPRGTLVNALLHHCRDLAGVGGILRPGIVHRLDRGTSGVMVIAKRDDAHHALAGQFHEHTVERSYEALVRGVPGADSGRIDRPIGRHPRDRKRMSVRTRSGREAHTAWRVHERFPRSGTSLLTVRPETGRTHQIRVHLACAGLPIAGDSVYGRGSRCRLGLDRPALHAAVLGFDHPRSGERLRFEAPLPGDFQAALDHLRRSEARR
jgi:23S rRNA pseudouridine1911/1915/1917 synthase